MKKLVYLAAALVMPWTAAAQNSHSRLTLTPRIGMTVSDFACCPIHDQYGPKAGFIAGADLEYSLSRTFSLSAGLFYGMQGAKENAVMLTTFTQTPDQETIYTGPARSTLRIVTGKNAHIDFDRDTSPGYFYLTSPRIHLSYISVPVTVQAHVWKGLALRLGVQWDHLASAHMKAKQETKINGTVSSGDYDQNIRKEFHKDAVAIPIGVSYNYKNIELDARYLWGVTKIADTNDLNDKEVMNSTFAITLGYRFHL